MFAHGNVGLSNARLTGATLAAFAVGLVPFSAFQVQLRAWLALHDSRTPARVNLRDHGDQRRRRRRPLPRAASRQKVVGLALGFSLSYLVGTLWFARAASRRRLGPANEHRVARTHIRLAAASLVAVVPAYVAARLLTAGSG